MRTNFFFFLPGPEPAFSDRVEKGLGRRWQDRKFLSLSYLAVSTVTENNSIGGSALVFLRRIILPGSVTSVQMWLNCLNFSKLFLTKFVVCQNTHLFYKLRSKKIKQMRTIQFYSNGMTGREGNSMIVF